VTKPNIHRVAGPLLAAKCTIPAARPNAVIRHRLHEWLLGNAATRLTVVVAPAGWGKTTLLSHWAHDPEEQRNVAWVSLDEADDEPVRFWTYVLTALGSHGIGGRALAALGANGLDPVDLAVPLLLNELESVPAGTTLVLDDYHLLRDPQLHESVEFLLAYLPPSLRLVIAGRADPPLPLARLRAQGELTEIRVSDLTFSVAEAGEMLAAVGATTLDELSVTRLHERTEGWAVGLQLTALTLREAARPTMSAATITGDHGHILDYFADEVICRLRPEQRDLLVRTSGLERLSGPLCDAVLERDGSAAILAELDRSDLFVAPLDTQRVWYRCHQLFRDALRSELSPEAAAQVLVRAADWYLAQGSLSEAISHRIAAGDHEEAAVLLRSSVPWFLERAALGTHLQLGDRLDPAVAQADPRLCVSLAWAAGLNGQYERMTPWLNAAERLITDDAPTLDGWHSLPAAALIMRAVQRQAEADIDGALLCAERAVELEDDATASGYVVARLILGGVLLVDDRAGEAVKVLDDASSCAAQLRLDPQLGLQAECSLALALFDCGEFEEARRLCTRLAPAVRAAEAAWAGSVAPGLVRLTMVEGRLAYYDGDLASAQELLRDAVAQARVWAPPSHLVAALTSLAEAELAAGDPTAARAALSEARETADTNPIWPSSARELVAVEARIGRGSARAARRAGLMVEELTDRELSILRMLPGPANQREIGAALYLSINTVKGYTKALYRKLDAATRQEAVSNARALGLI
jgi:ATP/maltotriose-dependent transcriptional regulator MalT